ncbi:flagellar biosynthesis anti-sigma factor FlgM [Leptospira sp. GIMC2001]|uniref:flagellar biosynthesis anti-sigma factor FlgM n=1 Tax=Leptospira sp. GIMC2001 TaxID=1513297 RepID=UPI00234B3DBF|nr:flagellar biosynthesis anti-sigma factor FlgM [Leptospira sp. GIMC2001]WCL48571.1 flagellar biosynthesis anti-sigma factor FlgM [Leptospira sp. GIMC2001]
MNIDRIGRVGGSGYEPKKASTTPKSETSLGQDSVTISDAAKQLSMEAKVRQEVTTIAKQILNEPETQEKTDKIKAVKEKLKNGEYDELSPEVLNKISERITEVFLG